MPLISWTHAWSNSDDGTILHGQDLGNIQADLAALLNGNLGAVNIADGSITAQKLAASANPALYANDVYAGNSSGFVATGLSYSSAAGLVATFLAGRSYIKKTSVSPNIWLEADTGVVNPTIVLTGSSDNYIDYKSDGTLAKVPVAVGSSEPGVTADATRLALVTTDATSVLSTKDMRQLDPLYQIRNTVYTGSKNKIINGDFNIWQRGTSFAAVSTEAYRADRWLNRIAGACVSTIRRGTDVPTPTQSGHFSNYSLEFEVTTADATIGAAEVVALEHKIEGYNWAALAQNPCVLSFWVKSSVAGTYCVGFRNGAADRVYIGEYKVWQANTWEKKVIQVSASPTAGTWNYTNGIGIQILFSLAAGSSFYGTANTWNTGNLFATSNQVNAVGTIGNIFRLSQVQIEAGSYASPFEKRDIDTEYRMCVRYYEELSGATNVNQNIASGFNESTTLQEFTLLYSEKRTAPSISVSNVTHFRVAYLATAAVTTNVTFSESNTRSARGEATTAAVLTAGQGSVFDCNDSAARVKIDSEL